MIKNFQAAMNIKRLFLCFVIFNTVFFLNAQNGSKYTKLLPKLEPKENQYVMVINGYDWGAACDSVIVNFGSAVKKAEIEAGDFSVDVIYKTDSGYGLVRGKRIVTQAYLSDANGNPVKNKSYFATVKFLVGPEVEYSNPYVSFAASFVVNELYSLRVTNEKLKFSANECSGVVSPLAGLFEIKESSYNEIKLKYAQFVPESVRNSEKSILNKIGLKQKKVPLIIWFHGISEGGQNPYKPLLGTKTTNLVSSEIQSYFEGGACVLVPQSPTSWLETTSKDAFGLRIWEVADVQGQVEKITKPVTDFLNKFFVIPGYTEQNRSGTTTDDATVSYYSTAVKKVIDSFIEENDFIDTKRIYVGGCSAGGYMTLNMVLQYPEFFAAAFTACEAYLDRKITEENLTVLEKMPLWFVYSESDTTIKPENFCIPTIERLKKREAKNLHVTSYKNVVDKTGLYLSEEGSPYEYGNHYAWVYLLNNDCKDEGISLFEWLSKQSR